MKPVKEYLEYRDFLRDFHAEKKSENSFYSLRYMGGKVSVDPSHLVKIFQRQRHIGNSLIEIFIKHCGLSGSDAEYFATLVRFNKAKSDRDSRMYYEKLLVLKGAGARSLEKSQYEFYTKWYFSAILTLLDFYPVIDDYAALAAKVSPPITEAKAKKSVALLQKLGLIRRTDQGTWQLTHKIITTGDHCRSIAVKAFQEETIRLAIEALHRHPPEKRNISTVTITVAEQNLDRINEIIAQFRENLLQLARDETHPDKVYQLNIQFFPLTQ
ncbi:MAG: TIGR02147 family protein [Chitinispirillaceae bacterium]|nr:TIGR02147 family protein [Chitinispirillaceae bacterium]